MTAIIDVDAHVEPGGDWLQPRRSDRLTETSSE